MLTRVYIQSEHLPDIKLIEINEEATIEELTNFAISVLPAEIDSNQLTLSVEGDDDSLCDKASHVKHLKHEHGIRIHLHRCKHINVQVSFNGNTVQRESNPAMTVGKIRQWAGHALGMQSADVAEHVLQISGSNEQPDIDVHIGALTQFPGCSVMFDLVPAHRING